MEREFIFMKLLWAFTNEIEKLESAYSKWIHIYPEHLVVFEVIAQENAMNGNVKPASDCSSFLRLIEAVKQDELMKFVQITKVLVRKKICSK